MNELSIIVPCLHFTDILPSFIDDISKYVMSNPNDIELIIITNESTNSGISVIDHVKKKYPWLRFRMIQRYGRTRSYGALVRLGLAYSTSTYAVLVSPYGEDDISIISQMLNKIRKGAQLVQASRYSSKENSTKVQFRFRIYQYIYRFLAKLLIGKKISDSTYSFKMFDRIFLQALGLTLNGYSICPEIVFKTLLATGKVEYIPVSMMQVKAHRTFKLYKEGIGYFLVLARGFAHRIGILWF